MKTCSSFSILLLLVLLTISGCEMLGLSYDSSDSSSDADYIGTWLGEDGGEWQQIVITDLSFITKFSDYSGMYPVVEAEKGTYSPSGDQMTINITHTWDYYWDDSDDDGYVDKNEWYHDPYSYTVTYSVSNDTLTVNMDGEIFQYTRQ